MLALSRGLALPSVALLGIALPSILEHKFPGGADCLCSTLQGFYYLSFAVIDIDELSVAYWQQQKECNTG